MNKKNIISHLVACVLGALGAFFGHDLSVFQKPAEVAAGVAVDKAADQIGKLLPVGEGETGE